MYIHCIDLDSGSELTYGDGTALAGNAVMAMRHRRGLSLGTKDEHTPTNHTDISSSGIRVSDMKINSIDRGGARGCVREGMNKSASTPVIPPYKWGSSNNNNSNNSSGRKGSIQSPAVSSRPPSASASTSSRPSSSSGRRVYSADTMKREASKFLLPNHTLTGLPTGSASESGYTKPASAPAAMMGPPSSSLGCRGALNTHNNNSHRYAAQAPTTSTAIDSNSDDQGIAPTTTSINSNSNKASSLLPLNRVLRNEHTLSVVHMDVVPQHAKTSSRRLHTRHHHNRHRHQQQQQQQHRAIGSSSDSIVVGAGVRGGEGEGSDGDDSSDGDDESDDSGEGGSEIRVQPLLAHIWPDNNCTTTEDNTTNSESNITSDSNNKVSRPVKRDNFLSTPPSNMVCTCFILSLYVADYTHLLFLPYYNY